MKSKICGISDSKTLEYLTNHPNSPDYIGFIVNYPKSKRFVEYNKLKELLKVKKKHTKYVAVLVEPDKNILEKIKNLPFDYYQIYDLSPEEIRVIKNRFKKKLLWLLLSKIKTIFLIINTTKMSLIFFYLIVKVMKKVYLLIIN